MTPNSLITSSPATEVPFSMYVPPLHPSNNFESYVSGEVTIHPSAAIAPGVLLQASPNSRILIGPGVCIGMGSVLHAHEGTLEVEAGANLGAGVLVVGKGKIGANACIGSTTTILNCSIEPRQVVAAGSLIGDESRQFGETPVGAFTGVASESASTPSAMPTARTTLPLGEREGLRPTSDAELPTTVTATANSETSDPASETTSEPTESVSESSEATSSKVHGQAHLNRLLSTMFPHRQSLSRPLKDGQSPSNNT